jgi:hypothetical protein
MGKDLEQKLFALTEQLSEKTEYIDIIPIINFIKIHLVVGLDC